MFADIKAAAPQRASPLLPSPVHPLLPPAIKEPAARLNAADILLIAKASRLELDLREQGLSREALRRWHQNQGLDAERIALSHDRQQRALADAREALPESLVLSRDEVTAELLSSAKLVLSFGGDNHFCYVAHRLTNQIVAGINSDPVTSEGALTSFQASDIKQLVARVQAGDYLVEEWTRMDVAVGGTFVGRAVNDVFLGERERQYMSRHLLRWRGAIEEQKGSGLLVSTGANSFGWYLSASRYLHPEGAPFPRTEPLLRFLLSEPYCGRTSCARLLEGDIAPHDSLEVTSFNDADGVVTLDSLTSARFPRGSTATIRISPLPLKVLRLDQ